MSLKIKKTDLLAFVMIFLIFTYSFTKAGLHNYIYVNSFVCYFSFALIALIAAKLGTTSSLVNMTHLEALLLLCTIVLLANRNQNFTNGEFEDAFSFVTIVLFLIFLRGQECWHKFIVPVMLFWIFIHSVATIMEYAIPGFYMDYVFPLMPSYASVHLSSVFKLGYMPGLSVHYSTNGMYLGVGLIVVSIVLIYCERRKRKLSMFTVLFVAVALLLTGKRALVIFPVLSLIILYYLYNSNKPLTRIGKLIILALIVVVLFMIGSIFIPSLSNFIIRFSEASAKGDVSLGRFETYAMALNLFSKNWLFGGGWDSFKYFYKALNSSLLNVHNIYIQLLCENGILGSIPFFAFFVIAIYRAIGSFVYLRKKHTGEFSSAEFYLGLSVSMQFFFLLYGLTGNPLYDQQVFYPYIVCITAGEFYVSRVRELRWQSQKIGEI